MSIFQTDTTKFRELNSDKVLYTLPGHSQSAPNTCTVTSELPVPRKGNPGTLKTFINIHKSTVLDPGLDTERVVPIVGKVELSIPAGANISDVGTLLTYVAGTLGFDALDPSRALILDGILPQGI